MKRTRDINYGDNPEEGVVVNWGDVLLFGGEGKEEDESLMKRFGYAMLFNALQGGANTEQLKKLNVVFGLGLREDMLEKARARVVMKTRAGEFVGGRYMGKVKGREWGEAVNESLLDSGVLKP